MKNKNLLIGLAALVFIAGFVIWGMNQPKNSSTVLPKSETTLPKDAITYYYGQECPHCQDVLKFLKENKISEKVNFSKKEVWHDAANKSEMDERIKECNLKASEVGVPFLYARGQCLIGTPKVEEFFRKEAGL